MVLLVLLLLVPCVVLSFAVSPQSAAHLRLFELPVIFWAIWALISLWAELNASTWLRTLGEPVDPLGREVRADRHPRGIADWEDSRDADQLQGRDHSTASQRGTKRGSYPATLIANKST